MLNRLGDASASVDVEDVGFWPYDSEDYAIGRAAFASKTPPEFNGR